MKVFGCFDPSYMDLYHSSEPRLKAHPIAQIGLKSIKLTHAFGNRCSDLTHGSLSLMINHVALVMVCLGLVEGARNA